MGRQRDGKRLLRNRFPFHLSQVSELSGTILGAFGDDVKALVLSLLRVLWKPASSSVLVVLGMFWCASFAKFAKWQGSFPTRKYQ